MLFHAKRIRKYDEIVPGPRVAVVDLRGRRKYIN
jgi:hypothetical protein